MKLYQGVTLGAKSFETDPDGNPVKGVKRHPDIGDHVTIYAHATILGGDTAVGARSIVGSNVWLMKSIPAEPQVGLARLFPVPSIERNVADGWSRGSRHSAFNSLRRIVFWDRFARNILVKTLIAFMLHLLRKDLIRDRYVRTPFGPWHNAGFQ